MQDFIYSLRVQIEDSDYAGVAYHANYLKYFERARSEWMEQNGFGLGWQKAQDIIFPIANITIAYMKPAYLDDNLEIIAGDIQVKKVGIIVDQYIRLRDNPKKIITKITTRLACIDSKHKLKKIPEELKKELLK